MWTQNPEEQLRLIMHRLLKAFLVPIAGMLLPVSFVSKASALDFTTVVIDAGHGGHDAGGIPGQRVPEKTMALDVAKRVQILLKQRGLRTVMTRSGDYFVPLGTRCAIANNQSRAIFVSVHFNSAQREGACGFETYYYGAAAAPMAARIQRNLLTTCSTENRGVKQRGFYVLRNTRIPAVLVECGFLTNGTEARRSLSAAHRQRLAEAIAEGVVAQKYSGSMVTTGLMRTSQ